MSVPQRNPQFVTNQIEAPVRICLDMSGSNRLPKNHPKRYEGLVNNFIKSLQPHDGSDYAVSLHDDLELRPGFARHVARCLEHAQGRAVSFYVPSQRIHLENYAKGMVLYETRKDIWLPAIAVPTQMGVAFAEWMTTQSDNQAEDKKWEKWLELTGQTIVIVYPSMCQHIGYDRSTLGNPPSVGKNKRTSNLYEPTFDFDSIDWKHEFEKL